MSKYIDQLCKVADSVSVGRVVADASRQSMSHKEFSEKWLSKLESANYSEAMVKRAAKALHTAGYESLKDGNKEVLVVAEDQNGTLVYSLNQRGWKRVADAKIARKSYADIAKENMVGLLCGYLRNDDEVKERFTKPLVERIVKEQQGDNFTMWRILQGAVEDWNLVDGAIDMVLEKVRTATKQEATREDLDKAAKFYAGYVIDLAKKSMPERKTDSVRDKVRDNVWDVGAELVEMFGADKVLDELLHWLGTDTQKEFFKDFIRLYIDYGEGDDLKDSLLEQME